MNTIVTTIDALYDHIVGFSIRAVSRMYSTFTIRRNPNLEIEQLEEEPLDTSTEESGATFKTLDEVLRSKLLPAKTEAVAHVKNLVMYTSSVDVPVYMNPTIEFDTMLGTIPFGEMVMMLETKGRFYRVVWKVLDGWVLKEDLVDRIAYIHPEFAIGQDNNAQDVNTQHIRSILNDEFGIARADFPLQAGEYVLYKLWQKNLNIPWPPERPRTLGMWHKILRGNDSVHVSVMPKTSSIMEYMHDDAFGHVAYVDAVFPDNTISISEVNFPDSGKYNERILTKEEWKELRPVFIHIQ